MLLLNLGTEWDLKHIDPSAVLLPCQIFTWISDNLLDRKNAYRVLSGLKSLTTFLQPLLRELGQQTHRDDGILQRFLLPIQKHTAIHV